MKVPPWEMFLSESDKYSRFDENVRIPLFSPELLDLPHWMAGVVALGCSWEGGRGAGAVLSVTACEFAGSVPPTLDGCPHPGALVAVRFISCPSRTKEVPPPGHVPAVGQACEPVR